MMKKNDLKELIKNRSNNLFCLVGPNSSGKTFFLSDVFNSLEDALFFHEDGRVTLSNNRKNVTIVNGDYLYIDDSNRGKALPNSFERDEISIDSQNIVNYSTGKMKSIDTKHLSFGSEKLVRLLKTFISYNLNDIKYILLDEPENSLDDINLKVVAKLIEVLIENSKTVVMVSHSPRLLEILKVDIDSVYVFSKPFEDEIKHSSFGYVISLFDSIGTKLMELSDKYSADIKGHEKYVFKPGTPFRKHYIETILHSYDFYKTLFYSEVILVEGLTELYLIKEIQRTLPISDNYYVAHGKNKVPFLLELFSLLCDSVKCFFDSDFKENGDPNSFSPALTNFINENYEKRTTLYCIPKDIETFLGIDMKSIIMGITNDPKMTKNQSDNFKQKYKEYLCLHAIVSNPNAKKKIIKLFSEKTFDDFLTDEGNEKQ